jgi:hypothetical protein
VSPERARWNPLSRADMSFSNRFVQEPRKSVENGLKSKAKESSTEVAALEKKMKARRPPLSRQSSG